MGEKGEIHEMNYFIVQAYIHQQAQSVSLPDVTVGNSLLYLPQPAKDPLELKVASEKPAERRLSSLTP